MSLLETLDRYWNEITAWGALIDLLLTVLTIGWVLTIKKDTTSALALVLACHSAAGAGHGAVRSARLQPCPSAGEPEEGAQAVIPHQQSARPRRRRPRTGGNAIGARLGGHGPARRGASTPFR